MEEARDLAKQENAGVRLGHPGPSLCLAPLQRSSLFVIAELVAQTSPSPLELLTHPG